MNVLVKYPTRSRPRLFREQMARYQQDKSANFLITIDRDDETMNNPEMLKWLYELPRTKFRVSDCQSKVQAVNDGVLEAKWDLLIVASDDMIPQRKDYAKRIADLYEEFFPEGDGVLHLNDGNTQRSLNTLPILDRKYFERFGYVYHPNYVSVFCDDEFQKVSESMGRSVYVDEVVIRHEWIGGTAPDKLHRHNESFFRQDEATFRRRQKAGFPE